MPQQRTSPFAERSPSDPAPSSSAFRADGPTPFLLQPRAQSALRHELAAIEAGIGPELERRRAGDPDSTFELHVLPHRVIVRLGDAGISFSWVGSAGGQGATVAEGRLLVIQWIGVATEIRGVSALRSARPVRECVYRAEGADAEHWRWRVEGGEGADGETYTTDHLVAEWLSSSSTPRSM